MGPSRSGSSPARAATLNMNDFEDHAQHDGLVLVGE